MLNESLCRGLMSLNSLGKVHLFNDIRNLVDSKFMKATALTPLHHLGHELIELGLDLLGLGPDVVILDHRFISTELHVEVAPLVFPLLGEDHVTLLVNGDMVGGLKGLSLGTRTHEEVHLTVLYLALSWRLGVGNDVDGIIVVHTSHVGSGPTGVRSQMSSELRWGSGSFGGRCWSFSGGLHNLLLGGRALDWNRSTNVLVFQISWYWCLIFFSVEFCSSGN